MFKLLLRDVTSANKLFNASLLSGIFPQSWKQANVIPIPKVNSPTSIQSDLRPISLTTPTLSKILESYVGNWILDRVTAKLDPRQFGALRGRSTVEYVDDTTMLWSICYTLGTKPLINVSLSECYLSTFVRPSIMLTMIKSQIILQELEIPGPLLLLNGLDHFLRDGSNV